MNLFDIQYIALSVWGYDMSWLELVGTLFGLVAVWLSGKENIWSWSLGIINVLLYGILFYQIQLYSDMFLQIYFFITNCIGWYSWLFPPKRLENQEHQLKIRALSKSNIIQILFLIAGMSIVLGWCMSRIHLWFPLYFPKPASFPYLDTIVLCGSMVAQWLLAKKIYQNWAIWIGVDILATIIYFYKGTYLLSIVFFIFLLIAIKGHLEWKQRLQGNPI